MSTTFRVKEKHRKEIHIYVDSRSEDFVVWSRCLVHGSVITFHNILWDVITNPYHRDLLMLRNASNMLIFEDFGDRSNLGPVSISDKTPYFIIKSCKVSKPRDLYLELSDRSEIRQAPRQHCCRCVCQIRSDRTILNTNLAASRLCENSRLDVLSNIETGPYGMAL